MLPSPDKLRPQEIALFLDFDGTLVVFDRPDLNRPEVSPALVKLIEDLGHATQGATAIITGRRIDDIDALFHPLKLNVSGEHGAQWRQQGKEDGVSPSPSLDPLAEICKKMLAPFPGTWVERKKYSLVLHVHEYAYLRTSLMQDLAVHCQPETGLKPILAHGMVEIMPSKISKGSAVNYFMGQEPYKGRRPVFIGDDVADEDGFRAVNALQGVSIKVGPGQTAANYRLSDTHAVKTWLGTLIER